MMFMKGAKALMESRENSVAKVVKKRYNTSFFLGMCMYLNILKKLNIGPFFLYKLQIYID
jgi:hypothetical protein